MVPRLKRIVFGVVLGMGVLAAGMWLLVHMLGDRETLYAGKPLSYWFQQMDSRVPAVSNEVRVALETQVIPQLMRAMFTDTNDSSLRLMLIDGLNKLPGVNITADTADTRRAVAAEMLGEFGPRAQAALPSLVKAVKSQDGATRESATRALGKIHSQPDEIIPLLLACLDDPQEGVPEAAAGALGNFGPLAKAAVPKLLPWLQARDKEKRHAAVIALPQIDRAAAAEAGIK